MLPIRVTKLRGVDGCFPSNYPNVSPLATWKKIVMENGLKMQFLSTFARRFGFSLLPICFAIFNTFWSCISTVHFGEFLYFNILFQTQVNFYHIYASLFFFNSMHIKSTLRFNSSVLTLVPICSKVDWSVQ